MCLYNNALSGSAHTDLFAQTIPLSWRVPPVSDCFPLNLFHMPRMTLKLNHHHSRSLSARDIGHVEDKEYLIGKSGISGKTISWITGRFNSYVSS